MEIPSGPEGRVDVDQRRVPRRVVAMLGALGLAACAGTEPAGSPDVDGSSPAVARESGTQSVQGTLDAMREAALCG
jgi:hypothetical protein